MKKMLVTGGAGFIGANFCHYWLENYPNDQLIVLDALTYAGHRKHIASLESQGLVFVQGDICDELLIEKLFEQHQINTLVHFAAESHVDRSISGPDAFIQTNVLGTHSLLKVAKKHWLDKGVDDHRFHHVSTDEVYGSLTDTAPAFTEQTSFAPNSPYSASKAASDHLVRAYHHTYGLRVTTSNCSNNYGPYQDNEKLIPLIIKNILLGKSLPIYGDGKNIRDWLYVEDHCRAIDLILQRGKPGEVYNVGGENEWRNIDIVNLICSLLDEYFARDASLCERFHLSPCANGGTAKSLITYVTDRLGHDRRYAIDPGKCHAELNYRPVESFETGIRKTIAWMLQNQ
ncbi:dTDP-glucose 4,6-dehydratase [Cellvibrio zantedeschiae]|uniref:dTDP-glucose 4,6-dehydratase n=1 Tax=Cellvibrio zantedeschiae TaxID=1237077 RepID=A0ABQ3B749_9GAMM|nr:dTDP-glucose 4,6-dehydratase [Cellvibrio zantedeschiae]GGY82436.1 dTDP-glucose 4,6-dehydratase [Cellvibrio zantedeschiae]